MTQVELVRKARVIWYDQRCKAGARYKREEFVAWYIREYRKKKKWVCAHVARKNHRKPYSFDNIMLQERVENVRERLKRRGNPGFKRRPVRAGGKVFPSMHAAARHYGIAFRTVWNHCHGRTKKGYLGRGFKWA